MTTWWTSRRLLEAPKGSFFLFGVRGAGKTTWTHAAFREAHVFDLLDEGLYQSILQRPDRAARVGSHRKRGVVPLGHRRKAHRVSFHRGGLRDGPRSLRSLKLPPQDYGGQASYGPAFAKAARRHEFDHID